MKYSKIKALLLSAAVLLVAGCGGAIDASIGGSITGLSGGTDVVLLDNAGDALTVSANGNFTFATQIEAGNTYDVTVGTQPLGETCAVENGIGTVEQSIGNVTSVTVICQATPSANNYVLGTLSGLTSGNSVTLEVNGNASNFTTLTTDGIFSFPIGLSTGSVYDVAVTAQPSNQTCSLTNATGTIPASGTITPVAVTCN